MRYGFFCKIPFVERNTELPQYLIKQKKPRSIRGFPPVFANATPRDSQRSTWLIVAVHYPY